MKVETIKQGSITAQSKSGCIGITSYTSFPGRVIHLLQLCNGSLNLCWIQATQLLSELSHHLQQRTAKTVEIIVCKEHTLLSNLFESALRLTNNSYGGILVTRLHLSYYLGKMSDNSHLLGLGLSLSSIFFCPVNRQIKVCLTAKTAQELNTLEVLRPGYYNLEEIFRRINGTFLMSTTICDKICTDSPKTIYA